MKRENLEHPKIYALFLMDSLHVLCLLYCFTLTCERRGHNDMTGIDNSGLPVS